MLLDQMRTDKESADNLIFSKNEMLEKAREQVEDLTEKCTELEKGIFFTFVLSLIFFLFFFLFFFFCFLFFYTLILFQSILS
jgi:hypothetical protein